MTPERSRCFTICVSIMVMLSFCATSALGESRFRQLTMADGLSNARIFAVLQDHYGYIWLATEDGLDRYDGYAVTIYKNNPDDTKSLSSDIVRALYQDNHGRLWIGTTGGGLDLYIPQTNSFKHYIHTATHPSSLSSNNILSIAGSADGKLLIGTSDSGLDLFDPDTDKAIHYSAADNERGPISNQINKIVTDKDGRIWLATQSGLDAFNETSGTFIHYYNQARSSETVRSIALDHDGRIWLAGSNGLQYLSPGQTTIKSTSDVNNSFITGNLSSVFVDSNDDLWVGSLDFGLFLKRHGSSSYVNFHQKTGDATSLSSNALWSIYQDAAGLIWVTTDNGVNILDPGMADTEYLRPLLIPGGGIHTSDKAGAIFNDGNYLWVSSTAGLYRVPLRISPTNAATRPSFLSPIDTKQYRIITAFLKLTKKSVLAATAGGWLLELGSSGAIKHRWKISDNTNQNDILIFNLLKDRDNSVYLATFGDGLLKFGLKNHQITKVTDVNPHGLPGDAKILEAITTSDRQLYLATVTGLFHISTSNNHSERVLLNPGGPEPEPISLYHDKEHHLWVGTIRGLWRLTLDSTSAVLTRKYFSIQDNSISGIEADHRGNLWLAGDRSVIRFNKATGAILSIGDAQNLPVSGFYASVHAHTDNGWLWFGGPDGLIGFDPGRLRPNPVAPVVTISGISIYRDKKTLRFHQEHAQPLELNYDDSLITFDLAVLDYGFPSANTFSYRLAGSQSDWSPPSTTHQIIFPSLEPGHYRLEVRGANNWGIWSRQPAILDVVVLPPWWRTWLAYLIYTLLVLSGMFFYVHTQQQKLRKEREINAKLRDADAIKSNFVSELEAQVSKATGQLKSTLEAVNLKNQELEVAHRRASEGEQLKSQFLANMSHELRTPLTAILGYLKLLLQTNASAEQKEYLRTVQNSSESLLAIINDTLDLSRIESGKLLIDEVDFDLLELIESTIELLGPSAYAKQLTLLRIVPPEIPLNVRGDPLRIRQVLTNLVGNAIKFTDSGSVCVRVQEIARRDKDVTLGIAVSDTGIGIPAASIGKLFDAYTRHESGSRTVTEGTGLGLSICKKLLDLMGGEIEVLSTPGVGSTFEFRLTFKIQKVGQVSRQIFGHAKIALYDIHPLSHQAWRASLSRLGLEIISIRSLSTLREREINALVVVLSIDDLQHISDTAMNMGSIAVPHLVLAPTADRNTLDRISEICKCRVQNTVIRESVLLSELRALLPSPSEAKAVAAHARSASALAHDAGERRPVILVADDNAINRKLLVTLLRQNHYRVLEAGDGEELIRLASGEHWDAALVDIHMPDMDGMEATQKLLAMSPDARPPIIAVSADALPETRASARAAGMQDYLVKPYTEQQLLEMLRKYLPA